MKLTVNGVDIEIEGAAEVEVDGNTVKIKTREPSFQRYFVPSPFWVQPPPLLPPYITWTDTSGSETITGGCENVTSDPYLVT